LSFFISDSLKGRVTEESVAGVMFQLEVCENIFPLNDLDLEKMTIVVKCSLFDIQQIIDEPAIVKYVNNAMQITKLKLVKLTKHDDTYLCKFFLCEGINV
jgi:mannitol-specific phosphotransferase system IIBC component